MEVLMKIKGLVVDPISRMPIVVLEDPLSDRILPIWIGVFEANAIALSLEGVSTPRPMTHDLMKNFLEQLNIAVDRVVVNDVRENTFYAIIYCRHNDTPYLIDSRPSDAIALALRLNAPIYVEEEVIRKAQSLKNEENLENSGKTKSRWLENLKPEDLGKYKM